jgi:hypothetical protein
LNPDSVFARWDLAKVVSPLVIGGGNLTDLLVREQFHFYSRQSRTVRIDEHA